MIEQPVYEWGNEAICPICRGPAEIGTVYAADTKFLRWLPGSPGFGGNVKASFGSGEIVGDKNFLAGTHAKGIRCRSCRRIVLEA